MLIIIQMTTPWIIGLSPTSFKTTLEREAPIKKRERVIPLRAIAVIPLVILVGIGKKVLSSIAKMKKTINQGIIFLLDLFLKISAVIIVKGIIHSARVSFTVVATCKASSP